MKVAKNEGKKVKNEGKKQKKVKKQKINGFTPKDHQFFTLGL